MLTIIQYPHPTLRKKAKPINFPTSEVGKLAKNMLNTLVPDPKNPIGVGLAATQVNKLDRLFIVKLPASPAGGPDKYEICLNPQIIKQSKKKLSQLPQKAQFLEGCLSIPGYYCFVDRPIKIKVRYQTIKGLEKQATLTPPYSSYFAHELDHLNGILFIDYLKKSEEQLYLANSKGKLEPIDNPFN